MTGSHLKYRQNLTKQDKGKIHTWINQPNFKADPGHRNTSVVSKFYKPFSAPASVSRVMYVVAKELKKNWGYMLQQVHHKKNQNLSSKPRLCSNICSTIINTAALRRRNISHMFTLQVDCRWKMNAIKKSMLN